jgi:uncharacterized protein YecT (DUF1311 family)
MRNLIMLVLICLPPPMLAQQGSQPNQKEALATQIKQGAELHARAQSIVQSEDARAKKQLCPKAMTTLDINACYNAELGATDSNYLKLVRALGLLLRSGGEAGAGAAPKPIPFDDAEAAWSSYRDLACKAAGDQYEGGTIRPSIEMGCRITVTRHHVDELWVIYSDLGTR